ncbi:MAG: translation initiation factor 2B subunit, eIF-2B alpha/beta/delta family [halophilic archaeon J07HX64]|jgi:Translation initiation factor 2B subunit, eIF-2B alpha/beta/delta family|nr:MAG: translation initiation factor 2B subunit, eIF-2B alpha/beta/delta family [halophilic archaeon J07HX64]
MCRTVRPVVHNKGEILLVRGVAGWDTVSGPAGTDPQQAARRTLTRTGFSATALELVRAGDPFAGGESEQIYPFLFDCERRDITVDEGGRAEWVPPPAILERETAAGLWESYDRVRPTVETVAGDTEHGSTHISVRALEVLRDEAALTIHGTGSGGVAPGDTGPVATVARELLAARPAMTAVLNRVHRVMSVADTTAAVPGVAHEAVGRARRVDDQAAATAADLLGTRVATLSRSGTVRQTLAAADPERVLVAVSRPGGEGAGVAHRLATKDNGPAVTVTTDAAFAAELATQEVETLLVGADSVLADGRVLNKTGTRGAALAAAHEGIDVVVVTASDKISPGTGYDREERDPAEVYDGPAPVSVANPTFDLTPPEVVDTVVTERGSLDSRAVAEIAAEHRALRGWHEDVS